MRRSHLKYGNIKTVVDGERFDSKKEAERWCVLKLLERAGHIANLRRQVRFPMEVNGQFICAYVADFTYDRGGLVVEDVKSPATRNEPTYRLKKKLLKALHGLDVAEV